jgi:glycosyltransferase involved in cell wall biosynthesis
MDMSTCLPSQISIIILTFNEEKNIIGCLESVYGWACDIFVVDSFSTDQTLSIARTYTDKINQNHWLSFAKQREWALNHLDIQTDWILFLDADERLTPEIKLEISGLIANKELLEKGYFIKRRFFFLNKWLKHGGYYPLPELRLFSSHDIHFFDEGGGARERFLVDGHTNMLNHDVVHIYDKGIQFWIAKHIKLARLEAQADLEVAKTAQKISGKFGSNSWLRNEVWPLLPRTIRPLILFFYRYILRLGFLDGQAGFFYCLLHDLWYPMMVEILYFEGRLQNLDQI